MSGAGIKFPALFYAYNWRGVGDMLEQDRGERLASLESEVRFIKDLLIGMNNKLDNYSTIYMPRTEINEKFNARDERLSKVEETQTWMWRTILGGAIVGAIGLVFFLAQKGLS